MAALLPELMQGELDTSLKIESGELPGQQPRRGGQCERHWWAWLECRNNSWCRLDSWRWWKKTKYYKGLCNYSTRHSSNHPAHS